MNNDIDKLRAEMQAKMQTMTDELYSQLGISESMLSKGSSVSAEIHSATDAMDARIHGFLAGQQYESDMHRDMRNNYAKLQDRYNCTVQELNTAKSYLSELINIVDSFGWADIQQCGRKDYACMNCKYFSNDLNHALCKDSEFFQWKHYQDAKALLAKDK